MTFRLQPLPTSPPARLGPLGSIAPSEPVRSSALALLGGVSPMPACAGSCSCPGSPGQGSIYQELGSSDSGWLAYDGPQLPQDGPSFKHEGSPGKHDSGSFSLDGLSPVLDGPSPKPDHAIPCPGGCDDNNLCTADSCQKDHCVDVSKICKDHDGCTTDSCQKTTQSCVYTPINCNDGDPCTIDSCKNNDCTYTKPSFIIYRSLNPTTLAHAYRKTPTPLHCLRAEAPVWRMLFTASTHTTPVFKQYGHITGDYTLATIASAGVAFCGDINESKLGDRLTQKLSSPIPGYRLYLASKGLHLSSTSSKEGTRSGYVLESRTFYACPS